MACSDCHKGEPLLEVELEKEIRDLEVEIIRLQERLAEKRRILGRVGGDAGGGDVAAFPVRPGAGARSIASLDIDHYEVGDQRFQEPGHVLDHFDVPHYFSSKYPGKGDQAAREILRWARRNPVRAQGIRVVFADAKATDLYTAVSSNWN